MSTVWNTTGEGEPNLTLDYVLRQYTKLGHNPMKLRCRCCYECTKCGHLLIDDLRTESSLSHKCNKEK